MNYFIFPDIDTTIYQASGSSNAGLDQILEVRKDMSTSGGNIRVSRILMKFDLNEVGNSISQSIVDQKIPAPSIVGAGGAKYYLKL